MISSPDVQQIKFEEKYPHSNANVFNLECFLIT